MRLISKLCGWSALALLLASTPSAYSNESDQGAAMDLQNFSVFPLGDKNDAYAKYFIGQSYLKILNTEQVTVANVTFEPGCRNNWHVHHKGGQILLVTAGKGYYQEWGKEAQILKPGDVVNIPPEVKHWHGAAADSALAHVAIEVPAEGQSNEWLEPVTDEDYAKLPK